MRPNRILPLNLLISLALVFCGVGSGCSDGDAGDPADASSPVDASDADDGSTADGSSTDIDADAGTDADTGLTMLVDHELWSPVDVGADPFDDAPEQIDCVSEAWGTEEIAPELTFFVRTQGCNYLTVAQPTLGAIAGGETVNIRLWHFDLTAPAASEAHLALQIGDHLVWEAYVPIPSDSGLLMDTWTAPAAIAAGEDIYFHVHNHGNNEYNLIEVSLSR